MSLALNQDKAEIDKRMSPDSTRKLQDEINVLTKRNCELESQLRSFDSGNSRDFHFDSTDGPDSGKHSTRQVRLSLNICFRKSERTGEDDKNFEATTRRISKRQAGLGGKIKAAGQGAQRRPSPKKISHVRILGSVRTPI